MTPEFWNITILKYMGGHKAQLQVGNQSFVIDDLVTKKESEWVALMLEKALKNLIYGELQRYEIFKKINDFEGETVESIIEKYLK